MPHHILWNIKVLAHSLAARPATRHGPGRPGNYRSTTPATHTNGAATIGVLAALRQTMAAAEIWAKLLQTEIRDAAKRRSRNMRMSLLMPCAAGYHHLGSPRSSLAKPRLCGPIYGYNSENSKFRSNINKRQRRASPPPNAAKTKCFLK